MDAVGITASIAQLAAYGHSVARSLLRLYQAIRTGPAAYQDQKSNISILLNIVRCVSGHDLLQEEIVVPLLVDISRIACKIINILERKGFLGLNWTLIVRGEVLSEAFVLLDAKRDLLHLHISERSQNTLSQIQSDTARFNMSFQGSGRRLGDGRRLGSGSTTASTQAAQTQAANERANNGSVMRDTNQNMGSGGPYVNATDSVVEGNSQASWANRNRDNPHVEGARARTTGGSKSEFANDNGSDSYNRN